MKTPKALKWLDQHFEEALMILFLILISVAMFLQIIMRFVFSAPMTWPEEFCRYCFVVSVMLATGYCIRSNRMLRIDVVINLFPPKVAALLDILATVLALVFCVIMVRPSITVTSGALTISQVSPAMEMPVWILYASAPVGFILGALRSLQTLIQKIRAFGKKPEAAAE